MNIVFELVKTAILILYYFIKSFVLLFVSKKKKDVSQDIILVTGAGSGLGRLMAIQFAKLGAVLVLWDVNEKGNTETAKMIENNKGKAFAYTCNLCNRNDVYKVAAKVKSEVGKVSVLINNAGVVTGKLLLECPDQMIETTFAVNVLSHFWTVKAFLPDMLEMKKGHIVTISSMAGYFGPNQLVDYSASKSAANGFNDTLTAEFRANGHDFMRTTLVCPYFMNTGMFSGVNTGVLPLLTPEMVCDATVNAVLKNKRIVIMPSYIMNFCLLFKAIVPIPVADETHSFLTKTSMKSFSGR